MNVDVSVVITTFRDGEYLDLLLSDLSAQDLDGKNIEIRLLDAGGYCYKRAVNFLGKKSGCLIYTNSPGLSRTLALNKLFKDSRGGVILRLDARSHISRDYVKKILELSVTSGASNVGGVMLPIGKTNNQKLVADIMRNPFAFGGAKSRSIAYKGYVDSVYLGAFNKYRCSYGDEWFDSRHPKISEDSDLNYRIRRNGGTVFMDSSIIVEHYPRESLGSFYRLCYNYGVGRGLFIFKHRVASAWRQIVPPMLILTYILFLYVVPWNVCGIIAKGIPISLYFTFLFFSCRKQGGLLRRLTITKGIIGCHVFWVLGLSVAPYFYVCDRLGFSRVEK